MALIRRTAAQWICGIGMIQLFFATGLTVCGFVVMGLYKNLDCKGIWAGLPMMIPALLSVIVLSTRHRLAGFAVVFTGVIILIFATYHGVSVWRDIDFWEKYKGYVESDSKPLPCYNRGDQCICQDFDEYVSSGYIVQKCDQFRTGLELFWTLIGLTIGGVLFTLINTILTIWACFTGYEVLENDEEDRGNHPPPEYDFGDARKDKYEVY